MVCLPGCQLGLTGMLTVKEPSMPTDMLLLVLDASAKAVTSAIVLAAFACRASCAGMPRVAKYAGIPPSRVSVTLLPGIKLLPCMTRVPSGATLELPLSERPGCHMVRPRLIKLAIIKIGMAIVRIISRGVQPRGLWRARGW